MQYPTAGDMFTYGGRCLVVLAGNAKSMDYVYLWSVYSHDTIGKIKKGSASSFTVWRACGWKHSRANLDLLYWIME